MNLKNTMKQAMALAMACAVMLVGGEALAAKKPSAKKQVSGVVNLNTGTASQLDLLPGVGAKAAKRIVEYRAQHPFATVEDLNKVKGFGKKKIEKLKPFLTLTGATTIKAVKATDTPNEKAQGRTPPSLR